MYERRGPEQNIILEAVLQQSLFNYIFSGMFFLMIDGVYTILTLYVQHIYILTLLWFIYSFFHRLI